MDTWQIVTVGILSYLVVMSLCVYQQFNKNNGEIGHEEGCICFVPVLNIIFLFYLLAETLYLRNKRRKELLERDNDNFNII